MKSQNLALVSALLLTFWTAGCLSGGAGGGGDPANNAVDSDDGRHPPADGNTTTNETRPPTWDGRTFGFTFMFTPTNFTFQIKEQLEINFSYYPNLIVRGLKIILPDPCNSIEDNSNTHYSNDFDHPSESETCTLSPGIYSVEVRPGVSATGRITAADARTPTKHGPA